MVEQGKLGILVGGGPAPGINGVISAVTIEARKRDLQVVGFYDGYKWLSEDNLDDVKNNSTTLQISDVSRVHFQGGSILRSSRTNPKRINNGVSNCVKNLVAMGIRYLVTIGGDDTVYGAWLVAKEVQEQGIDIKFAHVPKTIDNDLPLPENINTFGFATACHVGAMLLKNLMYDSKTIDRWMMAITMGRHTGHLALGIAKAAGATLAIVPEEFQGQQTSLAKVCDIIEAAMIKRKAMGHNNGIVVVAEGVSELFSDEEIEKIPGSKIRRDSYGNRRLAEVDIGKGIKLELENRYQQRGIPMRLVFSELGYLLRCADPVPQDQIYTRDLGYSAVYHLLSDEPKHRGNVIVCINDGELKPLSFDHIIDPATGKAKIRYLDITSFSFKVAQEYMIRLRDRDLEDIEFLEKMAKEAQMTPQEFSDKYRHTIFRA